MPIEQAFDSDTAGWWKVDLKTDQSEVAVQRAIEKLGDTKHPGLTPTVHLDPNYVRRAPTKSS